MPAARRAEREKAVNPGLAFVALVALVGAGYLGSLVGAWLARRRKP